MSDPGSPASHAPHPGLFDFQVNGFAGIDFQQDDLSVPQVRHAGEALRQHGTTRIFVTLITDHVDRLCHRLERLEQLCAGDPAIAWLIAGYHLEGPWLCPEPGYRGAHQSQAMHAPDEAEFNRLQTAAGGRIRLVTLSPEWPGSPGFISRLVQQGVHIALGHTNATAEQIDDAIAAGARFCTHLGNGVPSLLPRHDNVMQRLLARDELTACFIPDGAHLPPFVLRNFFRAKPAGRVLFTTDAMAGAAASPGRYTLGALTVDIGHDGIARQPDGSGFAGSTLTPNEGVRRVANYLQLSMEESQRLWSEAPARAFGVELNRSPDLSVPPAARHAVVDRLAIEIHAGRANASRAAARAAAAYLRDVVARQGEARVIFACAPSQDEFLAALVNPAITGVEVPWAQLTAFHMDEYVGITGNDPQSFRHYLRTHFLRHVNLRDFHPLMAENPASQEVCLAYGARLAEKPIDLICLGIGENGHIAFNDPPVADFDDPVLVKMVDLDTACRQQQVNDGCFASLAAVPAKALTLTIPVFRRARRLSIHVFGPRKAKAVGNMLHSAIRTDCPASILRTHPNATLYADDAAAAWCSGRSD